MNPYFGFPSIPRAAPFAFKEVQIGYVIGPDDVGLTLGLNFAGSISLPKINSLPFPRAYCVMLAALVGNITVIVPSGDNIRDGVADTGSMVLAHGSSALLIPWDVSSSGRWWLMRQGRTVPNGGAVGQVLTRIAGTGDPYAWQAGGG